jgi:hypothetical protein
LGEICQCVRFTQRLLSPFWPCPQWLTRKVQQAHRRPRPNPRRRRPRLRQHQLERQRPLQVKSGSTPALKSIIDPVTAITEKRSPASTCLRLMQRPQAPMPIMERPARPLSRRHPRDAQAQRPPVLFPAGTLVVSREMWPPVTLSPGHGVWSSQAVLDVLRRSKAPMTAKKVSGQIIEE